MPFDQIVIAHEEKLIFPEVETRIKKEYGVFKMKISNEDMRTQEGISLVDKIGEVMGCSPERLEDRVLILRLERFERKIQLRVVLKEEGQ
jgi:hypothetical protein